MPLLDQDNAIKQYWEEVKEQYPDISFEKFARICRAPFNFFKEIIKKDTLPVILVKYLGKIRVYPSRIKELLKDNEARRRTGYINEEIYNQRKSYLTNYLKLIEDDNKDND